MAPHEAAVRRREQHRADARRTILDATESLLMEAGYGGFSMRSLVDRCGYSAPTIYHYFGDKPGLLDSLLEERLQGLVGDLRKVPRRGEDPVVHVRDLCLAFAIWAKQNPSHYHLLTQPRAEEAPQLPSGQETLQLLSDPLDAFAELAFMSEADLEMLRQSIWTCVHGLISLPPVRPNVPWEKDLLERTLDALLNGWLELCRIRSSAGEQSGPLPGRD